MKMCYIYIDDLDCQVFGIYMTDLEKSAGCEMLTGAQQSAAMFPFRRYQCTACCFFRVFVLNRLFPARDMRAGAL